MDDYINTKFFHDIDMEYGIFLGVFNMNTYLYALISCWWSFQLYFFILKRTQWKFSDVENAEYTVLKSPLIIKATGRNIGNQSQNAAERTESWIQPPVNCTPTRVQLQTIGWFKTMNAQEKSHYSSFLLCNANSFPQIEK